MQLPFELDRPLVFFDLETTGLDLKNDRIVELAFIKLTPQGDVLERVRRFNPGIPIPAEATAVHGITDADVADEVPFCRTARNLADLLEGCDLAGFNIKRFDIPMLIHEFRRCDAEFSLSDRRMLDMQTIFHREERSDLTAAARFYLGREHEEAHTALGDIRTSAAVLGCPTRAVPNVPRGTWTDCTRTARSSLPFRTEVDRWFSSAEEGRCLPKRETQGTGARRRRCVTPPTICAGCSARNDMDEDVTKPSSGRRWMRRNTSGSISARPPG